VVVLHRLILLLFYQPTFASIGRILNKVADISLILQYQFYQHVAKTYIFLAFRLEAT
jgi:hypothetical protein